MSISDEIKNKFKTGSVLTKLISINIAVYFFILLSGFIFKIASDYMYNPLVFWLAVPSNITELYKFWTPFTYMFLHEDFLHILFNMLWLYWFGKIFLTYLDERHLINTYILGGLSGALFIIVIFSMPGLEKFQSPALGASAAVMAIVFAASFYQPDTKIALVFLGEVKLKYVALSIVALDIIMILSIDNNLGGHIAHLGGAAYGYYFITRYKKSQDISLWFTKASNTMINLFKFEDSPKNKKKATKKTTFTVSYNTTTGSAQKLSDFEYNANKQQVQEEIDRILDKISKSGYESLSKEEKETLFRMSDKY